MCVFVYVCVSARAFVFEHMHMNTPFPVIVIEYFCSPSSPSRAALIQTMFAVSVRSMGGGCKRVVLAPDATLADLRAELQRELPALHEVKLFDGLRELADYCKVEIELQGVTVPSPDMALAVLTDFWHAYPVECSGGQCRSADEAVALLGKMRDLSSAQCERMLELMDCDPVLQAMATWKIEGFF